MKSIIIISLLGLIATETIRSEEQEIKEVIISFTQAGDDQNVEQLLKLTSPNYRIVMNQLFGSNEVVTMNRDTYIQMIESKKFGGDTRKAAINSIIVSGKNAVVDVTLDGEAMDVRSLFTLCKDQNNKWVLVSDTPSIL